MLTKSYDWTAGHTTCERHDVVTSTTELARAHIVKAGNTPHWILARAQTKGLGRRGRPWASATGNFAGSYIFKHDLDPAMAALFSFVASLALFDTCRALGISDDELALKWPNDVLYQGQKLAGILLESDGPHLIIGIGVNLASAPDVDDLPAGALTPIALSDAKISPDAFLDILAENMDTRSQVFHAKGFAPIREDWLSHAARLGQVITTRLPNNEFTGVFETIDAHGHVVLKTDKGRQTIAAADIFFP